MERLRQPFFIAALLLMALSVLVELGAAELTRSAGQQTSNLQSLIGGDAELQEAMADLDEAELTQLMSSEKPPGLAIRYLALLDGILLFAVALMGLSQLINKQLHARIQGIATLIFALLLVLGSIVLIFIALGLTTLMIALFTAAPFGTIAYLAVYGFFNRGAASITLGLLMMLKIGFVVCLVLAQQRFLQSKGLVFMILTSFLGLLVVSFLHGLVPIFLVSITDAVAAIIVGILALIWAILLLVSAIVSVVKAVRLRV